MHHEGRLINFEEFENKFKIQTNFLIYEGIKKSVMSYISKLDIQNIQNVCPNPIYPFNIFHISEKLSSKYIYTKLIDSKYVQLPCYSKWARILDCEFSEKGLESI